MNRHVSVVLLVLALLPTLASAADDKKWFDCQVFDKTINGGKGSDARQGDMPVEAPALVAAEQQVREEYPTWADARRFAVQCRENDEG